MRHVRLSVHVCKQTKTITYLNKQMSLSRNKLVFKVFIINSEDSMAALIVCIVYLRKQTFSKYVLNRDLLQSLFLYLFYLFTFHPLLLKEARSESCLFFPPQFSQTCVLILRHSSLEGQQSGPRRPHTAPAQP